MKTINDWKLELRNLVAIQQDIASKASSEKRQLSQEEERQFDAAEADIRTAQKNIEVLKSVEDRAKEFLQDPEKREEQEQRTKLTPEQEAREKLHGLLRGRQAGIDAYQQWQEKRGTATQIVGNDPLGGHLVPEFWWNEIIDSMKAYGPMMDASVVQMVRTATGAKWNIPTSDQTAVKGALLDESAEDSVSDITFGTKALEAYLYTSNLIKASYEMLQDSAYPLEAYIGQQIQQRIGRIANQHLTTGTGSDQPNGIATASTLGKAAASTSAFTRLEILDLIHSVDVAYRGNARLMLNDATLLGIKKLTVGTSDDRPLYQVSAREGTPDTIEGYSFLVNNELATTGANARIMLFGDFSKYAVRVVNGLELRVLLEKYAEFRAVGYFGFLRLDGELLDTAAVKHLRLAAS